MGPHRNSRQSDRQSVYPTAKQIQDAYSQSPSSIIPPHNAFPSSGSNSVPVSTPEEINARRSVKTSTSTSTSSRVPFSSSSSGSRGRGGRRGRGRGSKYMDVGGFRVPAPPPAPIGGMPEVKNMELANELRGMLQGGEHDQEEPAMNDPDEHPEETRHQHHAHHDASLLAEAFQYEYCVPHHPDPSKSRVPAQLLPQDQDILTGDNMPQSADRDERNPFIPPWLVIQASTGGQEVGNGVIGSDTSGIRLDATFGLYTRIIDGHHGCDTPSYQFEEARRGVPVPAECLNPDLPPLAVEHPARMWNSLIHSMPPEMQPIVKWEYTMTAGEGNQKCFLAHMTVALPPDHPTLKNHSLAITLPKNRLAKEYIAVADLLGGVKRWSGDPRLRKADAQNTALVKCIADNAISWIHSPVNQEEIPISSDEMGVDEVDEVEEEVPIAPVPLSSAIIDSDSGGSPVDSPRSDTNVTEVEAKLPPIVPFASPPRPQYDQESSVAADDDENVGQGGKEDEGSQYGGSIISSNAESNLTGSRSPERFAPSTPEAVSSPPPTPPSWPFFRASPVHSLGPQDASPTASHGLDQGHQPAEPSAWARLEDMMYEASNGQKLRYREFVSEVRCGDQQIPTMYCRYLVLNRPGECKVWMCQKPYASIQEAREGLSNYVLASPCLWAQLNIEFLPRPAHTDDNVPANMHRWIEELYEICNNRGIDPPVSGTTVQSVPGGSETGVDMASLRVMGQAIYSPESLEPLVETLIPAWGGLAKVLVKMHCEKECCRRSNPQPDESDQ